MGYEELRRYNAGTSPRWQLESLVRSSGGVRVVDGVGVCSGCAGGYGREAGGGFLGVAGALRTVHNR